MSKPETLKPPKWPLRLLRFFVRDEYLEEIEGDMEELYEEYLESSTPSKANRIYLLEVIKLIRPNIMKKLFKTNPISHFGLFQNYTKTSSRMLMKNPTTSIINIFGLSMAIGITVLVYGFSRWVDKMDDHHVNKNSIYQVTVFVNRDGDLQQNGLTPRPLGAMLKNDFAQIQAVCRVESATAVVKRGVDTFHEKIDFADPSYLSMFTFPLKWGVPSSLSDPNSIIISEETSIKYFGDQNPIGKEIQLIFSAESKRTFKVTGVAEPFQDASDVSFNFLVNFENIKVADPAYDMYDWQQNVAATLIQVQNPEHLMAIDQNMDKYRELQNDGARDWSISSFQMERFATLYERSGNIVNSLASPYYDTNDKARIILGILGLFLFALACFNYINIAVVSATKRLKEIGLRKVIGSNRGMIMTQFLTENMLITFCALLIGVVLGTWVIVPWFERLNGFSMGFDLLEVNLWVYLLGVLVVTGLVSGLYPAIYVSKFQSAAIFKGTIRIGKKNALTKTILGFQLILSFLLIACAVMFTQNQTYMSQRSWGYNPIDMVYTKVPDESGYRQLKEAMSQSPEVISIEGSMDHIGKPLDKIVLHGAERQYEISKLAVGSQYIETAQLEILEGRGFIENHESDKNKIVVNESFLASTSLLDPIGAKFRIDTVDYEIVGVVRDFHNYSFDSKVSPTIMMLADQEDFRYLSMRLQSDKGLKANNDLQASWSTLFPETPFNGGLQVDVWGPYFEKLSMHANFFQTIASLAVLLAGLGLYGLVALNVAGRVREFSIRKVLGASINSLGGSVMKQFVPLFLISLTAGAVLSYKAVGAFFDFIYEYHIPMNPQGVLVALLLLIFVLLLAVAAQLSFISKSNPVVGLKTE